MHVNGETQVGLIYDSSFMSQIAANAVIKVRVRDLKITPYHVRGGEGIVWRRQQRGATVDMEAWPTGMQTVT